MNTSLSISISNQWVETILIPFEGQVKKGEIAGEKYFLFSRESPSISWGETLLF